MSLDDARQTFAQESEELLIEMEESLLALETEPESRELLDGLFRAIHTIKGAAGVFGYDDIVEFTHPVESEIDRIRQGDRQLNNEMISVLLRVKDHTQTLVTAVTTESSELSSDELNAQARGILSELLEDSKDRTAEATDTDRQPEEHSCGDAISAMIAQDITEPEWNTITETWLISLQFNEDTYRNGLDPISFIHYLKNLGEIKEILTSAPELPDFKDADFESCYLDFQIIFFSGASKEDIDNVFEFAQDNCTITIIPSKSKVDNYIELLDRLAPSESAKLGEILRSIGAVTERELQQALESQQDSDDSEGSNSATKLGEMLVDSQAVEKPVVEQALQKQKQAREISQSIRVDASKLGKLINLVGELVISSAAMKNLVSKHQILDAGDIVASVEHLVEDIRNHALELRMVPIGETFTRFRRVVRDVSKDLGKNIELVISGAESELDKTVVEKINDPLTHLIRNSLDHGIETPEQRLAAGKPAKGTLSLNAFHDSGHIVIQVKDDGKGLDSQKIRAKAESLGLVKADQSLSRLEELRLIFEPGLSTKAEASNLSGRGVGMDVVRRNIESLRGSIELDSEPGVGTTITIQLPLTLAIIDGFMVGAGGENYVIPLSMIEECVEMDCDDWQIDKKQNFINLRGDVMPYMRIKEFFGDHSSAEKPKHESLVVVRFGRNKAGFVVDTLYGEQQTVIKPLGPIFQNLQGISGATVLGSGEIALILDVQGLINIASNQARSQSVYTQHSTHAIGIN